MRYNSLVVIFLFSGILLGGCQKKHPRIREKLSISEEIIRQQTDQQDPLNISDQEEEKEEEEIFQKQSVQVPQPAQHSHEIVNSIVVRVNGTPILLSDLMRPRIDMGVPLLTRHDLDSGNQKAYEQAIQHVIDFELLFQKAVERNVVPSALEVDKQIIALKTVNGIDHLSQKEFEEELKKAGFTVESYSRQLAKILAVEKLRQAELTERAIVTSQEVEEYYRAHKSFDPEVYLLEVAYISDQQGEVSPIKEELLAQKNLKWERLPEITKDDISSQLTGLFTLKEGDILGPLKVAGGFQLIRLVERRKERAKTLDEEYSAIETRLREKKRAYFEHKILEELRDNAVIQYM